eukprot:COSAG03_NODE_1034_length_4987_cov_5.503069_5_plen_90_part_00
MPRLPLVRIDKGKLLIPQQQPNFASTLCFRADARPSSCNYHVCYMGQDRAAHHLRSATIGLFERQLSPRRAKSDMSLQTTTQRPCLSVI